MIKLVKSIFTLGFLPSAYHMLENTNAFSYTIPLIGRIISPIINYVVILLINLIDFFAWFISLIPGLNFIQEIVYRAPDALERMFPIIFGLGNGGHRNFITHSVFNPIFLLFLFIGAVLIRVFRNINERLSDVIMIIISIIALTFIGHLLADTMPMLWQGTALIKIKFFLYICALPGWLSKLWLYLNVILCFKALEITYGTENKQKNKV